LPMPDSAASRSTNSNVVAAMTIITCPSSRPAGRASSRVTSRDRPVPVGQRLEKQTVGGATSIRTVRSRKQTSSSTLARKQGLCWRVLGLRVTHTPADHALGPKAQSRREPGAPYRAVALRVGAASAAINRANYSLCRSDRSRRKPGGFAPVRRETRPACSTPRQWKSRLIVS
jgi:hypothetical protein